MTKQGCSTLLPRDSVIITAATDEAVHGAFSFASGRYEVYPNDLDHTVSSNAEVPVVDGEAPIN